MLNIALWIIGVVFYVCVTRWLAHLFTQIMHQRRIFISRDQRVSVLADDLYDEFLGVDATELFIAAPGLYLLICLIIYPIKRTLSAILSFNEKIVERVARQLTPDEIKKIEREQNIRELNSVYGKDNDAYLEWFHRLSPHYKKHLFSGMESIMNVSSISRGA